jgi:transformation/transcription domain-associated protein
MNQVLAGELSPFMCSGSHLVQVDVHPSAVHSILEGVSKCDPAVPIRPCILKVTYHNTITYQKRP